MTSFDNSTHFGAEQTLTQTMIKTDLNITHMCELICRRIRNFIFMSDKWALKDQMK